MNEFDENDPPVAQRTKVVTLMDVMGGMAKTSREAQPDRSKDTPLVILTLAHNGEIEQPMAFDLKDSKRMAVEIMNILAHFGDALCAQIVVDFFSEKDDE